MAHELRQGVGGGGCIPASLFKVFGVASGVPPPPDRRSNRELGRRREAPTHRCQCRRVPEATRSASLSSTSHRFAARPDPTRVSGRRAPDRERAARERCPSPPGPDPTPRGPDRKWSLPPTTDLVSEVPESAEPAHPDRPPGHDPAFFPSQVQGRRALDDESVVRKPDLQRGVDCRGHDHVDQAGADHLGTRKRTTRVDHGRRVSKGTSGYCSAGPSSRAAGWPFRCRSKNASE